MFLGQKVIYWKFSWMEIIPLQYKNKLFGKTFKFKSNNIISKDTLTYFASFCKDILKLWSKYYPNQPFLPSSIISQYLLFNSVIKTGNKVVFHRKFLGKT